MPVYSWRSTAAHTKDTSSIQSPHTISIQSPPDTLPVITKVAGIILWPLEELQAINIKTRKLPKIHRGFHLKSSNLRLYTKQKEMARELGSIMAIIQEETTSLSEYIMKMAPGMTSLVNASVRRRGQMHCHGKTSSAWHVPQTN